jgi:hypothetical protein
MTNMSEPVPAGVAIVHADGTTCQHDGEPQATMAEDGGPLCPGGQQVTHIRFGGRLLTIAEAYAAFSSMAETITKAIAPLAAAFVEFGRKLSTDPYIRALTAAAAVIEQEREREHAEHDGHGGAPGGG